MKESITVLITTCILITIISACGGGTGGAGSSEMNTPPVAYGRSLIVQSNSTAEFELGGKDIDGDILTYQIQQEPEHGILQKVSITTWKYAPYIDYEGQDSFTFVANDGIDDSKPALVNIFIGSANHAPDAVGQVVATDMNTSVEIILEASDEDEGDILQYYIESGSEPMHGTVTQSLTEPNVWTYTPEFGFRGVDSFVYRVSDGFFDSNAATVTITVSYVNEAPQAGNITLIADEGEDVAGSFIMTDANEGDTLTASIVDPPAHGSVVHDGKTFVYTPDDPDFYGTDSFTYQVYDGIDYSDETGTVSITINAINDIPKATDMTIAVLQGESITFDLPGTDPDNDPLIYEILTTVSNGTVTQPDSSLPEVTFQSTTTLGTVSFQYRVKDIYGNTSESKTITIVVKQAGVIFVKANATGNNDGSSWYHAYTHPQDAIDGALEGDSIWIAGGIYGPRAGSTESIITVNKTVEIYGGFTGTEHNISERLESAITDDNAASRTILNGNNSVKHIIVSNTDILIDKIMIQAGSYSVSGSPLLHLGGGLYHTAGSAIINNCLFDNNNAITGGGMYASSNTVISITNTTFQNNTAGENGGGLYVGENAQSSLDTIIFHKNHATKNGGGILIEENSDPLVSTIITNTTLTENTAYRTGGALCNLGNGSIINSVFTGNTAEQGGAVFDGKQDSHYTDCILTDNGKSSTINGGAFYTLGQVSITNLIFTGNTAKLGGAIFTDESSINNKGGIMITTSDFNNNTAIENGGAIFNFNSSAIFDRCEIGTNNGNTANQNGGAIVNSGHGSSIFWFCTVENNNAENGGAIFNLYGATPLFFGSRICNNASNVNGGAIYDYTENNTTDFITAAQYINCLITNNTQSQNGSVVIDQSKDVIYNCTIAYNTSTEIGDFYAGIYMVNAGTLHIENSILFNNPGIINVLQHQIYYSSGDSVTDEYNFILKSSSTETVFSTNDYYLRTYPIGQASDYYNPCINAGNPVFSNVISSDLYSIITDYGQTIDGRSDEREIDQGYHNPVSEILQNSITDYYHFEK